MDLCGTDAGHLVIIDTREGRDRRDGIVREEHDREGTRITVWGM